MQILNIIFWIFSIIIALLCVARWIGLFVDTGVFLKIIGVLGLIAAAVAFYFVYKWLQSIRISMIAAGFALYLFSVLDGKEPKQEPSTGPSFGSALMDSYCEYNLIKQAHKDAERELDRER